MLVLTATLLYWRRLLPTAAVAAEERQRAQRRARFCRRDMTTPLLQCAVVLHAHGLRMALLQRS